MGTRLLPLTVAELNVHALEFERDAALRYEAYAQRMRRLGEWGIAELFEAMLGEARDIVAALETACGGRKLAELSPWEHAWRLTYCPDAIERRPRLVPLSAREALQLALMSRRRAENYLDDVAANARDGTVRGHAAALLASARRGLQQLERRLTGEIRAEQLLRAAGSAGRLPG